MRRVLYFLTVITILSVTLSACQGATQPSTQATEPPVTEVPVTEPSTTAPPAIEIPATDAPILEPIDLVGPPMELGSKYMHVDGSILVAVPGGPFLMGSEYFGDKEHVVTISDFWIYGSKVTNGQYARCLEAGICTPPDPKNNRSFNNPVDISLPVTGVNYDQAAAYCTFVHGRLPTEAEWEKTARGPDGNIYPWGDASPACDLLNFHFCEGKPTDVTAYPQGASFYSALDMSGNAREWVADWFDAKYYDVSPDVNPTGPEIAQIRSVRGSSYQDSFDPSKSAHRSFLKPTQDQPDLGFRCVVEDPTFFAPYCQTLVLVGADQNGGPTDAVSPVDCGAQPELSQFISCDEQATYIKIETFPLPQGAQLQVSPECLGGPELYKCVGKGGITIVPQTCKLPKQSGYAGCAPGYSLDEEGSACLAAGPGEGCLPGFNFDPAAQCCVSETPGAPAFGACPPGFYTQENFCIPVLNNPPPLQTVQEISLVVNCSVGGDDSNTDDEPEDPGSCTPVCTEIRGVTTCTGCP